MTKTSTGYTRTLTDGTQITFNSSGYETATIDLNGLHTTYSYNGSNQLSSIEDPYGNFTTFTYSSGYLQTHQGPGGPADDVHDVREQARGGAAGG